MTSPSLSERTTSTLEIFEKSRGKGAKGIFFLVNSLNNIQRLFFIWCSTDRRNFLMLDLNYYGVVFDSEAAISNFRILIAIH
jgi:hypothetical protein